MCNVWHTEERHPVCRLVSKLCITWTIQQAFKDLLWRVSGLYITVQGKCFWKTCNSFWGSEGSGFHRDPADEHWYMWPALAGDASTPRCLILSPPLTAACATPHCCVPGLRGGWKRGHARWRRGQVQCNAHGVLYLQWDRAPRLPRGKACWGGRVGMGSVRVKIPAMMFQQWPWLCPRRLFSYP